MEHSLRRLKQDNSLSQERDKLSRVSHHPHSPSPFMHIQQSMGNAAFKQLLDSQGLDLVHLTKHPKHYVLLPQLLELIANLQSEEGTLIQQFNALTVGQQQALWHQMISESSFTKVFDMKLIQQNVEKLSQVELKPDEPFLEGNISDFGAELPPYTSAYQGLLSPYRTLWQWLDYKGNKQGEQDLLRKLDTLSLPAKQLLLHRLVGGTPLSTEALSTALTINQNEKLWVDWARIEQIRKQLNSLSPELIKHELAIMEQTDPIDGRQTTGPMEQETSEEDDGDILWLSLLGDGASSKEAAKDDFSALYNPEQLSMVLLGVSLTSREAVAPVHRDKFIERFLHIEASTSKPEMIEKLKEKRVKELGYPNVKALLHYITLVLVEQLEEHTRKRKDQRYITLLQRLKIMKGSTLPNKQQLHQALHKLFLQ